ncbi:hypothetical protein ACIB24_16380 [Spongisporangium articulatum]|uniref:Uncharacterized protein n=1 Tax=Spongisporangium articulatum TaxID=3362603 RepID=A0ABW8AQK2_9ACTN
MTEQPERAERLSPTPDDAQRHLDRLAGRLRVMGPRLAGRSGPEAAEHLAAVRAALQAVADLAADGEGQPHRPVPELAPHALADQALVLGHDLLTAARDRGDLFRSRAVEALDRVYALL